MTDVYRITPQMSDAWVAFDPGFEPREPLTVSQSGFVRAAFYSGYIAAINEAVSLAEQWRDENKAARDRASVRGRRRFNFDGDETQIVMAEQLDGAAIECNALAMALRALASCDTHPKDGDSTEIEAPLGSGAVPKADAQ